MRFMVMAAERAATMAARIHAIWRSVGQPCVVARAASRAPVSANGRAKTECSNLIISSTVRMRFAIGGYACFALLALCPDQRYMRSCGRPICANTRQTYCVARASIVLGWWEKEG